ncbi:MAG: hypothetical protein IT317_17660 [Anaerolineales bacterium]|nr:hypothetical protein [Anaerolineales bacterium]
MTTNPLRWQLADLSIESRWSGAALGERWAATVAACPPTSAPANLTVALELAAAVPPAPAAPPDFTQGDLLAYYLDPASGEVVAHFPRYGQVRLDLSAGYSEGQLTEAALATYGVFEDLLAISLSPHLRRRGLFLLHAFAACPAPGWPAVLIAGDIGAGKTTTGLGLLHAGWKLLSNDSPILQADAAGVRVRRYPGLLSAYPDTLERYSELRALNTAPATRQKVLFAAEAVYRDVWAEQAPAGALVFPQIEARDAHALERLAPPEALRLILPHAIEQWDKPLIAGHLALLNKLIQAVPAYRLRLAPDTDSLPSVLAGALNR